MKITDIYLTQGYEAEKFVTNINSKIVEFQRNGGVVEVQYSNSVTGTTIVYSALIIRRQK